MPKAFRQPETPNGGWIPPPWFSPSRPNFLKIFLMGIFSGSRNPTVIILLALTHDLENRGQTPFCMTFQISGCKHDTKLILVSILTFARSRVSKMLKTITWPWRLTLELKVTHIHCMTFLSYGCTCIHTWCRLDLGVDSNIVKVEDLRKPKISHLTLMFDLKNLSAIIDWELWF